MVHRCRQPTKRGPIRQAAAAAAARACALHSASQSDGSNSSSRRRIDYTAAGLLPRLASGGTGEEVAPWNAPVMPKRSSSKYPVGGACGGSQQSTHGGHVPLNPSGGALPVWPSCSNDACGASPPPRPRARTAGTLAGSLVPAGGRRSPAGRTRGGKGVPGNMQSAFTKSTSQSLSCLATEL